MAHFSEYQKSHYRQLFDKYSESHHGELTCTDLFYLMPQFGPELSMDQIRELIYRYDYHCKGTLDFECFLELLGDYESMFEGEKEQGKRAFEHFETMAGTEGLRREDLEKVLRSGNDALSDAEIQQLVDELFGSKEVISSHCLVDEQETSLSWVKDPPPSVEIPEPLTREIVIRVFHATQCEPHTRCKQRLGRGIDYETLDPMVSIKCCGVTQDTTVLIGHSRPEWGQELKLTIPFPSSDVYETQRWLKAQRLVFSMCDYQMGGVVPHMEYVGGASIPLWYVLRDGGAPITHVLTLKSPTIAPPGAPDVQLEVSVRLTQRSALSAQIFEFFQMPEEVYFARYEEKLREDLSKGLHFSQVGVGPDNADGPSPPADQPQQPPEPTLWDHYVATYKKLKHRFRRRNFQLAALDEYNTFRIFCTFVTPLSCHMPSQSAEDIAMNVSRISGGPVAASMTDNIPAIEPLQCCSPSLLLGRQHGNALEHAVLLCDLFLGIGLDAYVCKGHGTNEDRHTWVIVFNNTPASPSKPTHNGPKSSLDHDVRSPPWLDGPSQSESHRSQPTKISPRTSPSRSPFRRPQSARPANGRSPSPNRSAIRPHSARRTTDRPHRPASWDESGSPRKPVKDFPDKDRGSSIRRLLFPTPEDGPEVPEADAPLKEKVLKMFSSASASRMVPRDDCPLDFELANFYWAGHGVRRDIIGPRGKAVTVVHWESTTARQFNDCFADNFPFLRVGCIFNHRNLWVNLQQSDLIKRVRWDLDNPQHWEPFLSQDVVDRFGPMECWYSTPWLLEEPARVHPSLGPFGAEIEKFAEEVRLAIWEYRKNHLFIPDTLFHRSISRYLQGLVCKCEETLLAGGDRSFVEEAKQHIQRNLALDHLIWFGKPFRFTTANVDEIMDHLVWTGVLNCSVPGTVYAFGAQYFNYPWGLQSSWIWVGYLIDVHRSV